MNVMKVQKNQKFAELKLMQEQGCNNQFASSFISLSLYK